VFCEGGTRSRIGISVLRRAGLHAALDQGGGFPAHAEAGLPVE
jgi:rhodanese-related sulfurtransferase